MDQVGSHFFFFFFSHVVMVTAAGHFRTPSLARKASPGLGVIQEPRMGILRHINTQKEAQGQSGVRLNYAIITIYDPQCEFYEWAIIASAALFVYCVRVCV